MKTSQFSATQVQPGTDGLVTNGLIEVYRARHAPDAEFMSQKLRALGISARVVGGVLETLHGAGAAGSMNSVGVVVEAEDVNRARKEIKAWRENRSTRPVPSDAYKRTWFLAMLFSLAFILAVAIPLLAPQEWQNVLFAILFWFTLGTVITVAAFYNKLS